MHRGPRRRDDQEDELTHQDARRPVVGLAEDVAKTGVPRW